MAFTRKLQKIFKGSKKKKKGFDIDHGNEATAQAGPVVKAHPETENPDKVWTDMNLDEIIKPCHIPSLAELSPISSKRLRFVCISDTHQQVEKQGKIQIPDGDVLLHCGDFTMDGLISQVRRFNSYLGTLPHKHKVVIAGNHDQIFDRRMVSPKFAAHLKETSGCSHPRGLLTNCIYLQDEMVQIAGIKIYGSPWVAEYATDGFALQRGNELLEKWNQIPSSVDVLMTHSPPLGAGDLTRTDDHVGCVELINVVQQRIKPAYHVFGHIHEGYGTYTDGTTTFINASTCNRKYQALNSPIVFDIDIPKGFKKTDTVIRVNKQSTDFLTELSVHQGCESFDEDFEKCMISSPIRPERDL